MTIEINLKQKGAIAALRSSNLLGLRDFLKIVIRFYHTQPFTQEDKK
jgi:hypothetical protein